MSVNYFRTKAGVFLKVIGIIAEYNPFHKGHKYQIDYCKEKLKADYVIIAMSGDFVQRGTPALLPKHQRAEMALRSGADLVLELPVSVSTASAEGFAMGGISLLDSLHVVDQLCFGSEAGETAAMYSLAEVLTEEPDAYRHLLKTYLSQGISFPAARNLALEEYFKESRNFDGDDFDGVLTPLFNQITQILKFPNNILGIEYCKALLRLNSSIRPVTIKRQGMGYHETSLSNMHDSKSENYASASAIRHALKESPHCLQFVNELPETAADILENAVSQNAFVLENDFSLLLNYCLFNETPETLMRYSDMSKDLAARIMNQRNQFESYTQFTELLKTKELTYTRIQRALLHTVLQLKRQPSCLPYARILGFRKNASELLKEIKQFSSVPVITKASDASDILSSDALSIWEDNTRASNIYESVLAHKAGRSFIHEYQKQLVLI